MHSSQRLSAAFSANLLPHCYLSLRHLPKGTPKTHFYGNISFACRLETSVPVCLFTYCRHAHGFAFSISHQECHHTERLPHPCWLLPCPTLWLSINIVTVSFMQCLSLSYILQTWHGTALSVIQHPSKNATGMKDYIYPPFLASAVSYSLRQKILWPCHSCTAIN